jgi:hypothetical protein
MTGIFSHIKASIIISDGIKSPFSLQMCLRVNDQENLKENGTTETQYQVPMDAIL